MFPLGKLWGAKVAFSPGPATKIPRQFGPISRAPWAWTLAISCSCLRMPSTPVSAKPAEITHRARVPFRIAASASSSTDVPGTQKTARSTGSGMSATEA